MPYGEYSLSFLLQPQNSMIVFKLPINPESLEISYTARTNATPTLSSGYIENFGPGIGQISLSGTMGWGYGTGILQFAEQNPNGSYVFHGPNANANNGADALAQFISLYQGFLTQAAAAADPNTVQMVFVDTLMQQSFQVVPDPSGLHISSNKSSPLLRRYSLTLFMLSEIALSSGEHTSEPTFIQKFTTLLGRPGIPQPHAPKSSLKDAVTKVQPIIDVLDPQTTYTVVQGDTTASIARAYGLDENDLRRLNLITDGNNILAGSTLLLPNTNSAYWIV